MNLTYRKKVAAMSWVLAAMALWAGGSTDGQEIRAASPPREFVPGEIWRDLSGAPINAHGGGILFHEGVYYWYGELKEGRTYVPASNKSWGGTRVVAGGVSCYSSTNLYDWKREGVALASVPENPDHDLHCDKVMERPKVIYNRSTKKFVMWLHVDSADYAAARSGVAVSDRPAGPFHYLGSFRPNAGVWPENVRAADKTPGATNVLARDFQGGQMARDMTLFVDDDGKAYHFYASEENATMHVSRLTDDYLRPAGQYVRILEGRSMEAPAVFKRGGKYYLIASGCTGWNPNAARSAVATNISGPWTELGNPCRGEDADKTFYCQSAFVLPVQGRGDAYILMFDRWKQWDLADSRYAWLPLEFGAEGQPLVRWQNRWSFDSAPPANHTFAIGTNDFLLDGRRLQIRCGEIHAPRVPKEYWQHRLRLAKAMGLNTVCAYLFWNMHEPRPGEFDWSGQADAAEFCRLAQREGLWVILRPGPYACAEWEMGGLPWWLLRQPDIQLRTSDPQYLEAARTYLQEVGRVLGPLQVTRGGPILMVQVENEYGFFGKDAGYMGRLRQVLLDAGFEVPLFACNPPYALKNGYRPDLFPVVNFGSDPAGGFKALREILPQGPLMCGEFYPGWFDTWGAPHHTGNAGAYLRDLEYMLKAGASFSIYMAHGGTTFGLWAGADRPFKPDTSSYDYDAPISEAGWTTQKFQQTRDLFAKYLLPGETLPEPPQRNPVIAVKPFELGECAPVAANLPSPLTDEQPRSMEMYDQGYGCILYRATLPAGPAGTLAAAAIHDFGYVFLDGQRLGITDRRTGNYRVEIPARTGPATLDILVEPMGRVNFGVEVHDRKGIRGPVNFTPKGGAAVAVNGWSVYRLPLDGQMLGRLKFGPPRPGVPAFWRGKFTVEAVGDTFLDLRTWGKGVVWVNGRCFGRFWNIGPTQSAYVPAPWLRAGENELVILDHLGPEKPVAAGLEQPILDQLRPASDFARSRRGAATLHLEGVKPVQEGAFEAGTRVQEVKFRTLVSGRFFCLESVDAQDGKPYAAIAEIVLLGRDGKPLSTEGWKVAYVDSEERVKEDGSAENAIDGQTANFWHTEWGAASPPHPHRLVLDLGGAREVSGFSYTPRQGDDRVGGRIKHYRAYVGDTLVTRN